MSGMGCRVVFGPRDLPLKLTSYNDGTAAILCGLCGVELFGFEYGPASATIELGSLARRATDHVRESHSG